MPDHLRKFAVFILLENITDFSIYWHEMSTDRERSVCVGALSSIESLFKLAGGD